jgi:hypothetical protein
MKTGIRTRLTALLAGALLKQILVVSGCWLLSVLACAGERVPLWPEGQIPNFQPQQIAARTQAVKAPGFKARLSWPDQLP